MAKGEQDQSVVVIGAGPAGITAANEISKAGRPVDVLEASPFVGGLSRTLKLWNRRVDLGPHRFFCKDKRVNQIWLDAVGPKYDMVDRLTRIYYDGKFFQYPLKPVEAFAKLGPIEASRCAASYGQAQVTPPDDDGSFENWVVRAFGRRLFEIFFKTYSEKLWGITCKDLDSDFAAQRIKKFNLAEAVLSSFDRRNQSKHVTLVDKFAYPHHGTGWVYEQMAENIRARGDRVSLRTPVKRIALENGKVAGVELADGGKIDCKEVISTMPLTLMVQGLEGVPERVLKAARSLKFRNTILVYLLLESNDLFPDNWIYVHSNDLQTGRITNYRNWSPKLCEGSDGTVISMEYWANDEDPLWAQSDEELVALASDEIVRSGLAAGSPILGGHVERIRRCYPVYRRGYREVVDVIREYLDQIEGLHVIGRYGSFKYNNQDHSILMGLLAAENITAGAGHDLWSLNSDYSVYQEEALITESGLAPTIKGFRHEAKPEMSVAKAS